MQSEPGFGTVSESSIHDRSSGPLETDGKPMRQRDQSDCGPACLAYLCKRYRRPQPVALLRQWCGTDRAGTTALGLVQAGARAGLTIRGVRAAPTDLETLPLPVVAHVILPSRHPHYVVLEKVGGRVVRVMDPAVGRAAAWPREKLTRSCSGVFLLAAPSYRSSSDPGQTRSDSKPSAWGRLRELLWPHRFGLVQAAVGGVLTTILGLATSFYVEKLLDVVLPDQDARLLFILGLSMIAVVLTRLLLGWLQGRLALRLAQRIDATLILGYYRHLLQLPRTFHDSMRVGELLSRVADAARIRVFLNQTLIALVLNPLVVTASLLGLFLYDWRIGGVAAVLVGLQAALYPVVNAINRRCQRATMARSAEWQSHLAESLQMHATVRAMTLEHREALRGEQHLVRLLRATRDAVRTGLWLGSVAQASAQFYTLATLWLGAWLVLHRQLSIGELMSAYTLAGFLVGPATALVGLNAAVQEALVATERLYEILDLEHEPLGGSRILNTETMGDVRFDDVTLQYPGRLPVLSQVNLLCRKGRFTVLGGPSGGGKSSILALIQAQHRCASGRISVGGCTLELFAVEGLRLGQAVVPQRIELFTGTILENLVPDGMAPDTTRLVEACRDADILDWIETQPGGFSAWLQEGGTNLSGGQRQRLALARALYRGAPLIMLDEPTSALDAVGEARLVATLRRKVQAGATVLVVSHARAFLDEADEVIWLADGRVVTTPPRPGSAENERLAANP